MTSIQTKSSSRSILSGLAIVMVLAGTAVPAAAKGPAYIGTWATSAKACKLPPDTLDAPVVMTARAYNQFETHCDFKSIKKVGSVWTAAAKCLVTGAVEKDTLKITASTKTMSLKWNSAPGALRFVRCK